ncbi:MAG: tetratricopeptide repeat protein [Planctomycetota bacterium]
MTLWLLMTLLVWCEEPERAQDRQQLEREASQAMQAGDFASAVGLLERLVSQIPNDTNLRNNLGYCYKKLDRIDDAHRAFEAVLARQPGNAFASLQLGNLAWERGDLDSARRLYQRALTSDPGNDSVKQNLAALLGEIALRDRLDLHRGRVQATFWLAIVACVLVAAAALAWGMRLHWKVDHATPRG